MGIERLKRLLKEKEGICLEFKESRTEMPKNLFESICAMLNRDGGDVILGVNDNGKVTGVDSSKVDKIVKEIVNLSNNPTKLDPPFILFPSVLEINNEKIIHIQIPASSQLHKTANTVFDRSSDGDFKISQSHQIAEIYNKKRNFYSEGIIFEAIRFEDFKPELFPKVRALIKSYNPNHPWLLIDDREMLEKAGLWKRDPHTAKEGYTLAAVLLFGKDEVIQNVVPHYKIDALVRIKNTDRYDDREYIQTNLIEAYEQLMSFVQKNLPDVFYLEDDQRISLRSKIFREVVANLIVHREYTNAYPCSFIIYSDRVETFNANNVNGSGPINPDRFTPFAKNPTIVKFFIQLGRVDDLGSGVLNVSHYIKHYSKGQVALFIEEPVFKTMVPKPVDFRIEGAIEGAIEGVTKRVMDKLKTVLSAIAEKEGERIPYYAEKTGLHEKTIERYMKQLKDAKLIEFIGDASQTGGYFLTEKGRNR